MKFTRHENSEVSIFWFLCVWLRMPLTTDPQCGSLLQREQDLNTPDNLFAPYLEAMRELRNTAIGHDHGSE